MDSPVEPVIPHKLHAKYDFWRIRENSKVLQFLCRLKLQVRALNYPSRQEGADAIRTLRAICAESQAWDGEGRGFGSVRFCSVGQRGTGLGQRGTGLLSQ